MSRVLCCCACLRVSVHGDPPKPVDYQYDLPTNAEELRKGRWDLSMELKAQTDSIFGATLEDVMKLQKVPTAFPLLVIAVIARNLACYLLLGDDDATDENDV